MILDGHLPGGEIDDELTYPDRRFAVTALGTAGGDRLNARDQLPGIERLGQEVIRAKARLLIL